METGGDWRSFRCPVCGHSEGAELRGEGLARVRCSYCATALEVVARGPEAAAVRVALAESGPRLLERT